TAIETFRMVVMSPPRAELDPEGTADRIRAELPLDLHRRRRCRGTEVGEFGIRAAEARPCLDVAARKAQRGLVGARQRADHQLSRNLIRRRDLAELPERRVLVVHAGVLLVIARPPQTELHPAGARGIVVDRVLSEIVVPPR